MYTYWYAATATKEGVTVWRDERRVQANDTDGLRFLIESRYGAYFAREMAFNGTHWLFIQPDGTRLAVSVEDA